MKVSTKGRYGLLAMFDLALHGQAEPVPLKQVAERQGLSEPYLEQLFGPLRKAGLVRSVRGPQGGYLLARPAGEVAVGDIMRVLEGPIAPVECANPERAGDPAGAARDCCGRTERCATAGVWLRLGEAISAVLDGITLADLVEDFRARRPEPMYYI